jgi:EAL domain-containing protein (putative c-di-GMP-specific phosphodiesterase class I)/CheY-like chemotaxis protein
VPSQVDAPGGTILLVDDDDQVRRALATILSAAGYAVETASDGDEALALAHERSFDVALVDRQMPGVDGIEVLQQLRDIQPACARILLTGGLDLDTTVSAINRGEIARVLEKPCGVEALRSAVTQALEGRRRAAHAYQHLGRAGSSVPRRQLVELLASDRVQLALQPIVRAGGDRRVVACEALLRSSDPVLIGPAEVLAAAERHAMISELAEVVVARAADWLEKLSRDLLLFINLHPLELADADALAARLASLEPHAHRVVLEITERSSLYGVDGWERSVAAITGRGFSVAVDDLGAGYSSLSILAELQPRYIKVDMSITRDVDSIPRKQRLFDLLCRFADATDALLVAEGIESEAEARAVMECGAHLMQGYHFGKPRQALPTRAAEASA